MEALVRLLAEYPAETVRGLLHPTQGLAARSRFLPTVAETKALLEEIAEERQRQAENYFLRPASVAALIESRAEAEKPPDPEIVEGLQKLLTDLAGGVRFPASMARQKGYAEGHWPERERSDAWKRRDALFRRTQCEPGAAILEHQRRRDAAE